MLKSTMRLDWLVKVIIVLNILLHAAEAGLSQMRCAKLPGTNTNDVLCGCGKLAGASDGRTATMYRLNLDTLTWSQDPVSNSLLWIH